MKRSSWRLMSCVPSATPSRRAISPLAACSSTRGLLDVGCRSLASKRYAAPSPPPKPVAGSAVRVVTSGSGGSVTNVPCPGRVSTRPREIRDFTASRIVLRDPPNCSLRSSSVGSCLPRRIPAGLYLLAKFIGDPPIQGVSHRPSRRDLPLCWLRHLSGVTSPQSGQAASGDFGHAQPDRALSAHDLPGQNTSQILG